MAGAFIFVLSCLVYGVLGGRPSTQGPAVSTPPAIPAAVSAPASNYLPPSKPAVVVSRPVAQNPGSVAQTQISPRPSTAGTTARPITLPIAPPARPVTGGKIGTTARPITLPIAPPTRPVSGGKIGIPASGSRTVGSRAPY